MCGITAIIHLDNQPVSRDNLVRMTQNIAHRGPDDEGYFCNKSIALGHKRLSIIDLSDKGHQPMMAENHRWVIVYNGEVYNYKELRNELIEQGQQFYSNTDTEVVLKAFIKWGKKALDYFNGMFAFIVYDTHTQEVFIARDRYGIIPLYFTQINNKLLVASEIKAFLGHLDFRSSIDLEGLFEYFTFQNFFTNRTLFKNVNIFPPGHYWQISLNSASPGALKKYWDYSFIESEKCSTNEYYEELDRLFKQAVSRQLIGDVEIGAYLSGGMDSGSIVAVATQKFPYMKSFTCGFDLHSASGIELNYDERSSAELMSYAFKTEHYEMVLKAGDMERILAQLVRCLEEPRVGQSYPNFYISQLASKFVKVVLTGSGGDEMFAGYPWRYYSAVNNRGFKDYIDQYYSFWQRMLTDEERYNLFQPIWSQVKDICTRSIFRNVFPQKCSKFNGVEDCVNHSLYFEAKTFLHGLLVIENKISMAHSLETRIPFLDNDLVDFAMRTPIRLKLRNLTPTMRLNENEPGAKSAKYYQKTNDGKLILREIMKQYIPGKIIEREKQGFSAPDASWFKGESIDYVKQILWDKNARIASILDIKAIHKLVEDHLQGKQNRRLLIWSLLTVEVWCRQFLD